MNKQRALELIKASLGKIENNEKITPDTVISESFVLLGANSPLDSIEFITFVTDLEELISTEANKDLYLVVNEIPEFDINQPHLSVAVLAQHIVTLSEEK